MTISVWGWGATSITTWGYGKCCEDYIPVLVCIYLGGGAWSCVLKRDDAEGIVEIRSQTNGVFLRLKGIPGLREKSILLADRSKGIPGLREKPSTVDERSQGWPWQSGEICYER